MVWSMMRVPVLFLPICLTITACAPAVPDSGQGVGFQDFNGGFQGSATQPQRPPAILPPGFSPDQIGAAIDRADGLGGPVPAPVPTAPVVGAVIGAPAGSGGGSDLPSIRPRGNAPAGIREQSGEIAAASGRISDENDFNAVSQRETIESDRARIERNRAQYQVIQPGALPTRSGETAPNIVDYALATSHPRGTQLYRRSAFGAGGAAAKCAGYASPDLAQTAFLERGGPERDRLGLDPDGDGYACAWDPSPYRLR
jgi:hypothetical protein